MIPSGYYTASWDVVIDTYEDTSGDVTIYLHVDENGKAVVQIRNRTISIGERWYSYNRITRQLERATVEDLQAIEAYPTCKCCGWKLFESVFRAIEKEEFDSAVSEKDTSESGPLEEK